MSDISGVDPSTLRADTLPIDGQTIGVVTKLASSVFGPQATEDDDTSKKNESWMKKTQDDLHTSIQNVQDIASLVGGVLKGAAGTVAGAGAQGQAALDQTKQGVAQSAAALTTKAQIEGAARDKEVNDNLTVATAENMTAPQMVERANRMTMLAGNIQAENDDLRQRAGVSIFDDPLSYVKNMFTTPFVQEKHDADLKAFQEENAILQAQSQQTQDGYKINSGVDAAHGADYTKAVTDDIAGQARQKNAAAALEAARFSSANAQVTASLTEAQMNNAVKAASVANSAAAEARAQDIFDINTGNLEGRAAITQQRAKDLQEADTENRIATAGLGIPGLNNTNIKQLKGPQAQAFEIAKNSIYGGVAAGQSPSEAALGPDPLTAVFVKQTLGIKMNNPAAEDTATWIRNTQAEMAGTKLKGEGGASISFERLKPEERNTLVNERIQQKYNNLYSNIPASGSPLSPAPLSSILKSPLFAGTDLGKALSPLAINPLAPIDYDTMTYQVEKLIDSGKISIPQAAAQMRILGNTMTSQVNQFRGLSRLGLTPLGTEQRPSFNVVLKSGPNDTRKTDLNNQADIENYLTRSKAARDVALSGYQYIPIAAP